MNQEDHFGHCGQYEKMQRQLEGGNKLEVSEVSPAIFYVDVRIVAERFYKLGGVRACAFSTPLLCPLCKYRL